MPLKEGICRICCELAPLSWEHVPPRAAFNDSLIKGFKEGEYDPLSDSIAKVTVSQNGSKFQSVCEGCNNSVLGARYVNPYVEWVNQAIRSLGVARRGGQPCGRFNIQRLECLKQVVAMFLAVNDETFANAHPHLRGFVLDANSRDLPGYYRIYCYYYDSQILRYLPLSLEGESFQTTKSFAASEIAFPPFGFLLTLGAYRRVGVAEITDFKYGHVKKSEVTCLDMPLLRPVTNLTGDFREKDEILRDFERNVNSEPIDPDQFSDSEIDEMRSKMNVNTERLAKRAPINFHGT